MLGVVFCKLGTQNRILNEIQISSLTQEYFERLLAEMVFFSGASKVS